MGPATFIHVPHNAIALYDSNTSGYRVAQDTDFNLSTRGTVSSSNSYSGILLAGEAFTGDFVSVVNYPSLTLAVATNTSGTLISNFSPNGEDLDSILSYSVESGRNEVHRLSITREYFRVIYRNQSNTSGYVRLQTIFGSQQALTAPLNSNLQKDSDSIVTRSVLVGQTDGGQFRYVPITSEGHLETVVHGPRNPFGSLHVENLTPIFQADLVYGTVSQLMSVFTGFGGSVSDADSQLTLFTNTGIGGNATLQSRQRLRYRPGQGCVARFTAKFSTGIANSFQVAGLGHPGDGLYFGYSGTSFGVLHSRFGIREQQTLNLTGAANTAGNVSITLNGTNYSIPVSNSNNIFRTAYELSTGSYDGWSVETTGSSVLFLANSVGIKNNPFLITGGATAAGGSFQRIVTGEALEENWIPQSQWNIDPMNGSGPSAAILDPTKGNVYQIGYQYLGYGAITFQVENAPESNNPDFITVHAISYPNRKEKPSFRNPSFPFTASAYSAGSTSNLSVSTASFAGFIEGQKKLNGPQFSYTETSTAVSNTSYRALLTIKNSLIFKNKANQSVINILSIAAALKHTQPATIYIIKNASLIGAPSFSRYSPDSAVLYDNSATTLTFNDNSQILFSFSLAETGQDSFNLAEYGISLEPGESISIAARTSANTAAYLSVSLNTREDH